MSDIFVKLPFAQDHKEAPNHETCPKVEADQAAESALVIWVNFRHVSLLFLKAFENEELPSWIFNAISPEITENAFNIVDANREQFDFTAANNLSLVSSPTKACLLYLDTAFFDLHNLRQDGTFEGCPEGEMIFNVDNTDFDLESVDEQYHLAEKFTDQFTPLMNAISQILASRLGLGSFYAHMATDAIIEQIQEDETVWERPLQEWFIPAYEAELKNYRQFFQDTLTKIDQEPEV